MGGRGACGNALCLFSQPFMGLGAQCMEMVQDCELRSGPRQLAHCPVQSGVTRARVLSLNKALGGGGRALGSVQGQRSNSLQNISPIFCQIVQLPECGHCSVRKLQVDYATANSLFVQRTLATVVAPFIVFHCFTFG